MCFGLGLKRAELLAPCLPRCAFPRGRSLLQAPFQPRRLASAHGQPLPTSARFETAAEALHAFYSSCLQPPKLRQARLNRSQLKSISEETSARQKAVSWRQQPDEELHREASSGRHGRATGLLCTGRCSRLALGGQACSLPPIRNSHFTTPPL